MNLIASADKNWAIGKDNKLLVRVPEDMKFFRRMTTGKVVVMGRRTLESFPNQAPLPNRVNIVLTRDRAYRKEGVVLVHDREELEEELKKYPEEDIYVVGGGSVYELLLPYCDTAYVTRIDMAYQADTFFPDLDKDPEWELVQESDEQTCFDIEFTFTVYRRKQK